VSLPKRAFRILTVFDGDTARISLNGELERGNLQLLARELFECDRRGVSVLVLDLAALEFIDAAAFRLLLATGRRMRGRGRHLSLVNPSAPVRRILEVTALAHTADVVDELLEPHIA